MNRTWAWTVGAVFAAAAGAVEASTEGGGTLPQLDTSTYPTQIFWLIVAFVVLYVLMTKVAAPRIAEVLEERQERIADDLEKAERLKAEADSVKANYEKAVAEARGQAQAMLREAAEEIAAANAKAEAEAATKVARKVKTAETRIGKARAEALSNLRSVASDVAGEAVQKLIGVKVDGAALEKAVDGAMEGRG